MGVEPGSSDGGPNTARHVESTDPYALESPRNRRFSARDNALLIHVPEQNDGLGLYSEGSTGTSDVTTDCGVCGVEVTDINEGILLNRLQTVGVDQKGALDINAFRRLWRAVFPMKIMDDRENQATEWMFHRMDEDRSGKVEFDEVLRYLQKSFREEEELAHKRPSTVREWVWAFTGNEALPWKKDTMKMVAYAFRFVSQIIIFISIITLMIDTMPEYYDSDTESLGNDNTFGIEAFCVAWFTLEFIGFVYSFPNGYRWIWKEFVFWIDLLTVTQFYVELAVGEPSMNSLISLRTHKTMRTIRIFRFLRLNLGKSRQPDLSLVLTKSFLSLWWLFLAIAVSMAVSSAFIFHAEKLDTYFNHTSEQWVRSADSEYYDAGDPILFQSIPDSLWWSIVTLTTVGYGDKYPNTGWGRFIGGLTMLAGLIVIGYPILVLGSVSASLHTEYDEERRRKLMATEFYHAIRKWLLKPMKDHQRTRTITSEVTVQALQRLQDMNKELDKLQEEEEEDKEELLESISSVEKTPRPEHAPKWALHLMDVVDKRLRSLESMIDHLESDIYNRSH